MNSVDTLGQKLNNLWDSYASEGKIHYNRNFLETKILDPQDGRLPFFLVFNEGRTEYLKMLPQIKRENFCPFCSSDFENLKMIDFGSLRILPNKYPCLPYQYILAPREHTSRLTSEFIINAIDFAKQSDFKVYYNGQGSGGSLNHLCFQASPKHSSSPKEDFFHWIRFSPKPKSRYGIERNSSLLFLNSGYGLERMEGPAYGLIVLGKNLVGIIKDSCEKIDKINLIFKNGDAYIFPRGNIEESTSFPGWKFGALELIGNFVCRDREIFEKTDYDSLERALKEVSLKTKEFYPYSERAVQVLMTSLEKITGDIRTRNTDKHMKSLVPDSNLSGEALIRYCEEQIQARLDPRVISKKLGERDDTVISFNPTSRTEDIFLFYNLAKKEFDRVFPDKVFTQNHPVFQSVKSIYNNIPTSEFDELGHDLDDRCWIKD